MGMFGFDERYAMFGVTPVENQFILEYMPAARGDYVKVYLYGLAQCCHPQDGMCVEKLAQELGMEQTDVMAAMRYWERRGLVRCIAENPPVWRYLHPQERIFGGGNEYDNDFADFTAQMNRIFGADRSLHMSEITKAYEWVEQLKLPAEVVLYYVQFRKNTSGPKFSFSAAEKQVMELASAGVASIAEAEEFLTQDKRDSDACRKLLRRMGKRRNPSEDEVALYRIWTKEWGYSFDTIDAAVSETTKGEPTFAYLNGILRGILNRRGAAPASADELNAEREESARRIAPLKALLAEMRLNGVTVNEGTLAVYDEMRALYPDDVILIAGTECARTGGDLARVLELLQAWKDRGLTDAAAVNTYIRKFNETGAMVSALYEEWGRRGRPTKSDRETVTRWHEELKISRELILFCAPFAKDAEKPMAYLNSILNDCVEKGITTPEAVLAQREEYRAGRAAKPAVAAPALRTVPAQNYEQREYEASTVAPDWMLRMFEEMNANAGQDPSGTAG